MPLLRVGNDLPERKPVENLNMKSDNKTNVGGGQNAARIRREDTVPWWVGDHCHLSIS
jgi:hypothetical protein